LIWCVMNSFNLDWNDVEVQRVVDMTCEAAVNEGAEAVLKDAKALCPIEKNGRSGEGWKVRVPGALRDSGRIVKFKNSSGVGAYVKFGGEGYMSKGVDTYYAAFVELGTPGEIYKAKSKKGQEREPIEAKPFIRPALRKNKTKIIKKFNGAMNG
jgi:HK97 gp10 family phage protein